ncbi:MAG: DNA-3-methyladenine glycosylase I [Deltaproteobacteria bacterium]|nr:DNA-3-methyladenine glycosylase I [Deltaproteobacteria bacterium]MBW2533083.1 DNA-3-methyladenine glycosylase I [Deltaproteobacteria bacterium]
MKDGLVVGDDGLVRCWWAASAPDYAAYHDDEWGQPVTNDHRLFEKICLEGFQSGLSWLTILRKREAFREVFAGFDFERVARFNRRSVERLLKDARIVRHRGKIESTIHNAKRAREIAETYGSLAAYFWQFEPPPAERSPTMDKAALMTLAKTPASTRLSKDLKKRGWSYVGPTTVYAFMQAMGMVNDHLDGCPCRAVVDDARRRLTRPRP